MIPLVNTVRVQRSVSLVEHQKKKKNDYLYVGPAVVNPRDNFQAQQPITTT